MDLKEILKDLKWGGLFSAIFCTIVFLYRNFLIVPNIKCTIDSEQRKMNFSVKEDFRGITLKLYPQMVIEFDNYVVLLIHIDDYFQNSYLYFDEDNKCRAEIQGKEYTDMLKKHMQEEIVDLICAQDEEISPKDINERLNITVSVLGGVRYENEEGNVEKRYCIIVDNGLVHDYDVHDQEIVCRLNETSLEIQENFDDIDTDMEIEKIVMEIVKQIQQLRELQGG